MCWQNPPRNLAFPCCQAYLEVKARKEVYLAEEAAAQQHSGVFRNSLCISTPTPRLYFDVRHQESYFHYLQPKAREAAVLAASRGLSQALGKGTTGTDSPQVRVRFFQVLVLEHLDGDVVERSLAMKEVQEIGKGT